MSEKEVKSGISKITSRKIKDFLVKCIVWMASAFTVGILAWILYFVISNGIGHIDWEFLSSAPRRNGLEGGVLPLMVNTVYTILLSVSISAPIGVCSAIYLSEYAKPGKVLTIIRFATETLAGIPSIIYGLFGYMFFVVGLKMGWSLVSGALTLSIMALPTIIRTSEEAIKSIPEGYREGSLALGASKLRTIIKVVLPCGIPGIITAIILSMGRAVGETAAVYFTAGTAMTTSIPLRITDSGRTLAVHLFILAKEAISFEKAYATATVLIAVVLIANSVANAVGTKFKKRMGA